MEFIAILRNLLTLPLNVYLCLQVLVSIPKISHKTLQLEFYGFKEFIMAQKLHNIQYLIESIYNDIIIEFECDCLPQGTKSNSNLFFLVRTQSPKSHFNDYASVAETL